MNIKFVLNGKLVARRRAGDAIARICCARRLAGLTGTLSGW